jgi:predicted nucleotidyltransferase component of viral defense system
MAATIEEIKRLVIIALASDEQLMVTLVLKGGNAIDILQNKHARSLSRSSYDIDFSIAGDFDEDMEGIKGLIKKTISNTFLENGLTVFDYKFFLKPSSVRPEVKDFWGGYNIEFKIILTKEYHRAQGGMERLRRSAIAILPNNSPKIEIEISKYEYVKDKIEANVDGYLIYIYSPEMIVFEKVRAICQQFPEYAVIVPSHSPRPRARDFYDIFLIMDQHRIDPVLKKNKEMLACIFQAKHVPLDYLRLIHKNLAFHKQDWQNVLDTLPAKEEAESFDFYAGYVLNNFQKLTFD